MSRQRRRHGSLCENQAFGVFLEWAGLNGVESRRDTLQKFAK